ncbi:PEP-CTERM system TPR-repeat protein PrsT [Pseudomaricurvus alcaniphilus]|uniref:XrtA/PEP-CTERM system TPR-repeat protein PrsT n=1 Tax=Pseudomaricurvus alcaniphilus TaxID=1166482 RepID=UPI00140BF3F5|nr:PEP-CTERM system TPR-repeat protein PrsT [Pseudomaricurvus alcaniphilus]
MIPRSFLSLFSLIFAFGIASTQVVARESAHDYYESAQRYHNNGDQESALIELKNALSQDKRHVPSLLLSGDIYLLQGNSPAAEYAYGEALQQGADVAYTVPRIAEAYLLQNKYEKLLESLNVDQLSGSGKAELLGYRALAQQGIKDNLGSELSIAQALSIDPQSRVPNIAKAQLLLEKKRPDAAQTVTTLLIKRYPRDARSWNIRGAVLNALGFSEEAIAAYSEAVKHNPNLISARLARAALLAAAGRRDQAVIDVDYVRTQFPGDPGGAYLKAQFLEYEGETAAALEQYGICLEILSLAPPEYFTRHAMPTIMGAISAIKTGEPQRARTYLEAYHKHDSSNVQSGAMLAGLLLEDGEATAALNVLKPLLSQAPDNPELLDLNARVLNKLGWYKQAVSELQTLLKSDQGNLDVEARIARNRIMAGEVDQGIADMERVLSRDDTRVEDTFFLITTYLKKGNYARAITLSEKLIELAPGQPEFLNVLGRSYMYNGNLERAHKIIRGAANEHPDFLPVLISLAEIETAQGNLQQARDRLRSLANAYPESGEVMLQGARVERLLKNPESARKLAENAVSSNRNWVEPRKFLVYLLLEMNERAEAERFARESASIIPDSEELKFQLAQVLVAVGKPDQARNIYKLMSRGADTDHELLYRIAQRQTQLGVFSDASNSLFRAVRIKPDSLEYHQAFIQTELNQENYQQALELAIKLGQDFPESSAPYVLRAAAYSGLGQKRDAATQMEGARQIKPDDRDLLLGHYRALESLGELDQAEKVLADWLEKSPQDQAVKLAYTDLMIARKRWPEAEKLLGIMIEKQPDNPFLLNNLAFVLHEMGRPEAVDIARKAQRLAPTVPHINDTLGWILVGNAQAEESLLYLREAVARQSDSPVLRYHLAVALHHLGRNSEAVKHLTLALREDGEFEGRQAAGRLLDEIKSAGSL